MDKITANDILDVKIGVEDRKEVGRKSVRISITDLKNKVDAADGKHKKAEDKKAVVINTVEEDGDAYTITGYVPALLNGERVKLILIFDNENPKGYIAEADPDYDLSVTETQARGLIELQAGDSLDFLCDFYGYDGSYQDSYCLGETMTVADQMTISNTYLDSDYIVMYRFTDIYNNEFWSERLEK